MKYLILLFVSFSCYACDVLFYMQDAGETYALLPVAERLKKDGADVVILTGGTATNLVGVTGESIGRFGLSIDASWERTRKADQALALSVIEAFEPKVFVSGVAFEWEGQLYDACRKKGIKTIAFWDNFSADGQDLYFTVARTVEKRADTLFVPSEQVAAGFADRPSLSVVGQPSLERWAHEAREIETAAVRKRLGIESGKKIAVFVGGYGALYEEAFSLLLRSLETVKDWTVLVQPHPKFAGKFESEYLAKQPSLPVRVLKNEVSTIEAVAMADLVLCHQSTVGFQAMFLKKPVVYLIPEGQQAPSFAIYRVTKEAEFKEVTLKASEGKVFDGLPPTGSVERCVAILNKQME